MKYIKMEPKSKQIASSDETRKRLIQAGITLFGRSGKDAVSTRELAKEADTNLNAIQYHFGGKDELYLEVARELAQQISSQVRAMIEKVQENFRQLTPQEAAQLAADLIVQTSRTFLSLPDLALRGGFMMREQLQPTEAFNSVIYPEFIAPMHSVLTALVAKATGDQPNSARTITRAHALYGQALAFGAAGETWRRRLGTTENTEQNAQLAFDAIRQTTLATLHHYAATKDKT
jgi:TetR/AcrR family transcriptional regulator, regulator of cefoperazone and chloramphenicol sensitivity